MKIAWISFPEINLAHDPKIRVPRKLDEFSRKRSDSRNTGSENRVSENDTILIDVE